jgi:molybdenum storage protein
VPPYKLWEHPPRIGRIPQHRTDAGTFLVAEAFGCKTCTLVKDVDGLYSDDPKRNPSASFIAEIGAKELMRRNLPSLPFDPVILELLETAQTIDRFQLINVGKPELLGRALAGERVGSIIYRDS